MVGSWNSLSAVSRNTFVLWLLIYQSSTVHCQLCQIILRIPRIANFAVCRRRAL